MDLFMQNLPILIGFLLGVGLMTVEVFIPGFGIAGISGILIEVGVIALTYWIHGGLPAIGATLIVLSTTAILVSIMLRSVNKGRLSQSPLILNDEETTEEGYVAMSDMDVFLGKEGVTTTVLRPTGMAIFDGVKLNVLADGEFISKDEKVVVQQVSGASIIVKKMAC